MTIYVDTIVNVFLSWKLKALYHGEHDYCQCQGSKGIKDKIEFWSFGELYFQDNLIIVCVLNFLFVEVFHSVSIRDV